MPVAYVLCFSAILCLLRIVFTMHQPNVHAMSGLAAASHLWVGGLLGCWLIDKPPDSHHPDGVRYVGYLVLVGLMSLVEIVCFVISHLG